MTCTCQRTEGVLQYVCAACLAAVEAHNAARRAHWASARGQKELSRMVRKFKNCKGHPQLLATGEAARSGR